MVGGEVEMSYKMMDLSAEPVTRSGKLGWKATELTQPVWSPLRWCLIVGGEVEMSYIIVELSAEPVARSGKLW